MGVIDCGRNRFYDDPTKSCTDCSVICENMDIQDTREQCLNLCPDSDYFSTTTATTTITTVTTATAPVTVISQGWVIALCVLLAFLVLLIVTALIVRNKKKVVHIIKTNDCYGDEQSQVHAQETNPDSHKPECHSLLPTGQQAFPDMPRRDFDLSDLPR